MKTTVTYCRAWALAATFLLSLGSSLARAHDILYETRISPSAVVLRFHFPDHSPLAFEAYEIFADGEKNPIQVGRTDRKGQVAFLAEGGGAWRIKVVSEDGHGAEFAFSTDKDLTVVTHEKPLVERYPKLFTGLGIILSLFGLLSLFINRIQRRKTGAPHS